MLQVLYCDGIIIVSFLETTDNDHYSLKIQGFVLYEFYLNLTKIHAVFVTPTQQSSPLESKER